MPAALAGLGGQVNLPPHFTHFTCFTGATCKILTQYIGAAGRRRRGRAEERPDLRAFLAQQYKYWYNSTNTDAEGAAGRRQRRRPQRAEQDVSLFNTCSTCKTCIACSASGRAAGGGRGGGFGGGEGGEHGYREK